MFFLEKVLRNVRIRLDSDLHPCYSDVESRSIRCNRCSMLPTTAFSSSGATKIKTNVILELSTGTMDILDALPLVLPHLQELAHLDTASWSTQSAQLITSLKDQKIWIRIQDFDPMCIRIRIQGYVINLKFKKSFGGKIFNLKRIFFVKQENNGTGRDLL